MSNGNDHTTNSPKSGSIIQILGGASRQSGVQSDIPDEELAALNAHGKAAVELMRQENGAPVHSESLI
jgi:hypothetical protein